MSTLYDFLFIDQERVRSLYAQLFDGLHEAMESMVGKTASKSSKGQVGGDPFGHAAHERSEDVAESKSDRFSPHDLLLRDVIGALSEHGLICHDPANAQAGSIVLLSGTLTILDAGVMDVVFDLLPKMAASQNEAVVASAPKQYRKALKREHDRSMRDGMSIIEAFSKIMPKIVQIIITDPRVTAWGAVQQENMRAQIGSILVQQGPALFGEWHVLGIVDSDAHARPSADDHLPDIYQGIRSSLAAVQGLFSRPEGDICITPLLIFRKLCTTTAG